MDFFKCALENRRMAASAAAQGHMRDARARLAMGPRALGIGGLHHRFVTGEVVEQLPGLAPEVRAAGTSLARANRLVSRGELEAFAQNERFMFRLAPPLAAP